MPPVLVTFKDVFNVSEPILSHISWWVASWTAQLISIVSLSLEDCLHQTSPWSGTTVFGAVIYQVLRSMFYAKMSAILVHWVFLDISARSSPILKMLGLACTLLCHGQRCQFSSPNLQWFTRYDFKNLHPCFVWPSSYYTVSYRRCIVDVCDNTNTLWQHSATTLPDDTLWQQSVITACYSFNRARYGVYGPVQENGSVTWSSDLVWHCCCCFCCRTVVG